VVYQEGGPLHHGYSINCPNEECFLHDLEKVYPSFEELKASWNMRASGASPKVHF
jgi:hypothetical protein